MSVQIEPYGASQPGQKGLNERQFRAAEAIALGASERAIANDLPVSRSTLHEWKKLPEFATAVERFKAAVVDEVRNRLITGALPKALDRLNDALDNMPPDASVSDVLRAAELTFKLAGLLGGTGGVSVSNGGQAVVLQITPEIMKMSDDLIALTAPAPRTDCTGCGLRHGHKYGCSEAP